MAPVLFFLFLIETFSPIFSIIKASNDCRLGSFKIFRDCLFILKIFTKFSACLTERSFSIILFSVYYALFNPTKIFAWTGDNFLVSINFKTDSGKLNNLKKLAI